MTNRAAMAVTTLCVFAALPMAGSYALAASVQPLRVEAPHPHALHLKSGVVDTSIPVDTPIAAVGRGHAPGRFVIQLDGPIDRQRRADLQNAGISLGKYLPANAYIVKLDQAGADALANLDFVRWVGPFQDSWKLDPNLGRQQFKTDARIELAEEGLLQIVVVLFAGEDLGPATEQLADAGADVRNANLVGDQWMIDAVIPAEMAADLACIESVEFIEDAPEATRRNDSNAWIIQSNVNEPEEEPYTPVWDAGIHGEGQVAGLIDGTIRISHCAFEDPLYPLGAHPNHRKVIAMRNEMTPDRHGTHVAGTLAGDNAPYGVFNGYDGIAFAARISASDLELVWLYPSTFYPRLVDAHNDGARVHSNSWGDDSTTSYTTRCRQIDEFSYEYEEDLVAFAVTNYAALKTPENAKNVLAVGATYDTELQDSHYSGGMGPTADGRRKPEVYAPGYRTMSADYTTVPSCAWDTMSGTSMACPAVSGAGLLVRQYFTDGFYPTGTPVTEDALTPSGALMKAVLINSAVDMTGEVGYPSNVEGWGRVLLDNSLYFPGDAARLLVQDIRNADGLSTGDESVVRFAVLTADAPLRVTMVFTDPPGAVSSAEPVVNNLDLEVETPGGTVYLGNEITNGESTTGGTADAKNNVEQVMTASPTPGTYTITITGTAVNEGTQGYALVVTGDVVFDCNGNGLDDADDIADLTSYDCNINGTPDECEIDSYSPAPGGPFYCTILCDPDCDVDGTPDECQPDFDGDGDIDECDDDIDGDGVLNVDDACDYTIPGTPVDPDGRPIGDANDDCDVDLIDHAEFVSCLTASGPGGSGASQACLDAFDYDARGDGDVDLRDFAAFQNAFSDSN